MEVMKLTTKQGRNFYNSDHSPAVIKATLEHCPDWERIELLEMTEEQYYKIPATNDAAFLFEKVYHSK